MSGYLNGKSSCQHAKRKLLQDGIIPPPKAQRLSSPEHPVNGACEQTGVVEYKVCPNGFIWHESHSSPGIKTKPSVQFLPTYI